MSIVKGPLFSLDADGTIGKSLSYSKKSQNNIVSKYSKPGDVSPGESSPRQKDQRSIIRLITIHWQCMDDIDRLTWETAAKAARFKGSGYHYFLHLAQTDLKTYLGLVGYWSMNYETGGKIPDLSGNGNHGTLSPIYPCVSPTLVDSFSKKEGKAAKFDGTNDYIDTGNGTAINTSESNTFEALLKITDINIVDAALAIGSHQGNRSYMGIESSNYFIAYGNSFNRTFPVLDLTNNIWAHWVFIASSGTATLYINGKDVASFNYIGRGPQIVGQNIGARKDPNSPYSPEHFFPGNIDEVRIYNRALSQEEILKHYQSYNLP